ncbi:ATP-binding cassette domain-containing protein [Streptomyces sp. NPDC004284]|uniref:ATP-binding cassette domain-containing protein n=1 Tax=Streptomyces sp. NPDC004284 TaxID=3364695 RepID=UPI0036A15CE1
MIIAEGLTGSYGTVSAVQGVSLAVRPYEVTGLLGRPGAGKSTLLRLILGDIVPTEGSVAVQGRPVRGRRHPPQRVGASPDPASLPLSRTAREHLGESAAAAGIARARVGIVLQQVALASAARRPVGTYTRSERARLGVAEALLGDPPVILLDGLGDRLDGGELPRFGALLNGLAGEGRTIMVTGRALRPLTALTGRLVVVRDGRLVHDSDDGRPLRPDAADTVLVRTPLWQRLAYALADAGARVRLTDDDGLEVSDLGRDSIGALAREHGIPLTSLGGALWGGDPRDGAVPPAAPRREVPSGAKPLALAVRFPWPSGGTPDGEAGAGG